METGRRRIAEALELDRSRPVRNAGLAFAIFGVGLVAVTRALSGPVSGLPLSLLTILLVALFLLGVLPFLTGLAMLRGHDRLVVEPALGTVRWLSSLAWTGITPREQAAEWPLDDAFDRVEYRDRMVERTSGTGNGSQRVREIDARLVGDSAELELCGPGEKQATWRLAQRTARVLGRPLHDHAVEPPAVHSYQDEQLPDAPPSPPDASSSVVEPGESSLRIEAGPRLSSRDWPSVLAGLGGGVIVHVFADGLLRVVMGSVESASAHSWLVHGLALVPVLLGLHAWLRSGRPPETIVLNDEGLQLTTGATREPRLSWEQVEELRWVDDRHHWLAPTAVLRLRGSSLTLELGRHLDPDTRHWLWMRLRWHLQRE
ncbi:MAG: hypothetical protein AAF533_03225 [Acidobacteriota bacterium]